MRAMLVLMAVALLLGGAPAEAKGRSGGGSRAKSSRPKTQAVKKHTRKLPGGKRIPVKAHKRSEARR
jgi:hypothetical protein